MVDQPGVTIPSVQVEGSSEHLLKDKATAKKNITLPHLFQWTGEKGEYHTDTIFDIGAQEVSIKFSESFGNIFTYTFGQGVIW